jgi:carbon starvation protein
VSDANGNAMPAYRMVWPLFGSINQMFAGLTLVGLSLWLARSGRGMVVRLAVGLPMLFMMAMTATALVLQIARAPNAVFGTFAVVVLALATWITAEAAVALWQHRPRVTAAPR